MYVAITQCIVIASDHVSRGRKLAGAPSVSSSSNCRCSPPPSASLHAFAVKCYSWSFVGLKLACMLIHFLKGFHASCLHGATASCIFFLYIYKYLSWKGFHASCLHGATASCIFFLSIYIYNYLYIMVMHGSCLLMIARLIQSSRKTFACINDKPHVDTTHVEHFSITHHSWIHM